MKNILIYCAITLIFASCTGSSKTPSSTYNMFNYDSTCDFVGKEGTQAIVISSVQKDELEALRLARIQAVHAVLYKGLNSDQCKVPALVDRSVYAENQAYFDNFFSNGEYLKYIVSASDSPVEFFYVGKSVKVFSDVSVNRNSLRKQLEKDNILKSLGNIF